MDKHRSFPAPAVGGSSLLVIFAVLSLTVFALLSVSTALADRRLADASAQAVRDYYEADAAAEEIFARLRNGELPAEVTVESGQYCYTCPVAETQQLQVLLQLEDGRWTVLRWQTEATQKWQGDDSLPVWQGDSKK